MTNRRLIIKIQRRGGADNDAQIEAHARRVIAAMFSARMANTLRLTIKLRASVARDGRRGECQWRDLSKGATARSKHHTIQVLRDMTFAQQCRTLAHELQHVEQFATGRLTFRKTYGVYGYFWRAVGQTGPAIKFPATDGACETPWHARPWEIEAMAAERLYSGRN